MDSSENNYKIKHLKDHLTDYSIGIRSFSKDQIFVFQKKEIQIYEITSKFKINKQNTIKVDS